MKKYRFFEKWETVAIASIPQECKDSSKYVSALLEAVKRDFGSESSFRIKQRGNNLSVWLVTIYAESEHGSNAFDWDKFEG